MRSRDLLDPAQVNGVVNVILPVDVGRQNRQRHFENRIARHESDIGFQTKPFHQFLPDLHLQVRLQTAQNFFAMGRVHGSEITHQFVARLIFRVLTQTDADSDEGGDDPDGDIRCRNHAELRIKKEELGSQKRAVLPGAGFMLFYDNYER
jgi:hypothetical protein